MDETHIITMGRGKNKRQWELNDEEFERFEREFEENELIDVKDFNSSEWKVEFDEPNR